MLEPPESVVLTLVIPPRRESSFDCARSGVVTIAARATAISVRMARILCRKESGDITGRFKEKTHEPLRRYGRRAARILRRCTGTAERQNDEAPGHAVARHGDARGERHSACVRADE